MDKNQSSSSAQENEKKSGSLYKQIGELINGRTVFVFALKLVTFGIVLYVLLNHFGRLWELVTDIYELLSPLIMGGLLALVLNTPMTALEKLLFWLSKKIKLKPKARVIELVALTLTFVLVALFFYIILNAVIPQLGESIKSAYGKIIANLPEYSRILESYGIDADPIRDWITGIKVTDLITNITSNAGNIIGTVVSGTTSIITGLLSFITIVVFAVYLLANKKTLGRQLRKLMYAYLKKSMVDKTCEICKMSSATFSDFISGQCLDAFILGILMFISMSIFAFPYPLAVSSLIMATAVIPYIGAFLGGAFGVVLMILDDPLRALLFVVMFIVIQQIDNHLIYPRVVGKSVGLPAIWTFAAVIVGGGVCGVIGMVLFIPLFSVFYTLLKENVHSRLHERKIKVE